MPSIAGFWSYAHSDDESDDGRIVALARRLEDEYNLLTGEKLELFIDESTLMWGDDWRERIAAALERVTFFIPVITPTYFRRSECRKELLRFAREAREHRAERLILPIYYVEVPELESDVTPADEAMAAVRPFQREDLRRLRLENQDSAEHRLLINNLAHRIISIAREAEEADGGVGGIGGELIPVPSEQSSPDASAPDSKELEEEESEFFLEKMAKGEEALGGIKAPLEAMGEDIRTLGSLSEQAAKEMEEADKAGKPGFASRLAVASRLASRLDGPAKSMEHHAQEYVSRLYEVDPLANQLLDWALDPETEDEESKEAFLKSVLDLAIVTAETSEITSTLSRSLEESASFSRDLRQPLRVYQTSLRNIHDAQALIEQWARRAKGAPGSDLGSSDGDTEQD